MTYNYIFCVITFLLLNLEGKWGEKEKEEKREKRSEGKGIWGEGERGVERRDEEERGGRGGGGGAPVGMCCFLPHGNVSPRDHWTAWNPDRLGPTPRRQMLPRATRRPLREGRSWSVACSMVGPHLNRNFHQHWWKLLLRRGGNSPQSSKKMLLEMNE